MCVIKLKLEMKMTNLIEKWAKDTNRLKTGKKKNPTCKWSLNIWEDAHRIIGEMHIKTSPGLLFLTRSAEVHGVDSTFCGWCLALLIGVQSKTPLREENLVVYNAVNLQFCSLTQQSYICGLDSQDNLGWIQNDRYTAIHCSTMVW